MPIISRLSSMNPSTSFEIDRPSAFVSLHSASNATIQQVMAARVRMSGFLSLANITEKNNIIPAISIATKGRSIGTQAPGLTDTLNPLDFR